MDTTPSPEMLRANASLRARQEAIAAERARTAPRKQPVNFPSPPSTSQASPSVDPAVEEADRLARREAEERAAAIRLWVASGVPQRHALAAVGHDCQEWGAALQRLLAALKPQDGRLLALVGSRGTGKTQIAVEAVRAACKALRPSRYTKAMDFFLEVRASYWRPGRDGVSMSEPEREVLERFVAPALLVVDALEERAETAFEDRLLAHLLDRRYDDRKDTILITNQTPEAFAEAVGKSVVDRLRETGGIVTCEWGSFRAGSRA